jgi:hypothetical protein
MESQARKNLKTEISLLQNGVIPGWYSDVCDATLPRYFLGSLVSLKKDRLLDDEASGESLW